MIKRNVKFTVVADGTVTSAVPQYGGVKGEHNATLLGIALDSGVYEEGDTVRLSFTTGDGTVLSSDIVEVENGTYIEYALPQVLTIAAGQLCVRVVLSKLENGIETETFRSDEAVLWFDDAGVENGTPFWTGVSQMLARTVTASKTAVEAQGAAQSAQELAQSARDAAERHANNASVSEQNADALAQKASNAASAAEGFKNDAGDFSATALGYRDEASGFAADAQEAQTKAEAALVFIDRSMPTIQQNKEDAENARAAAQSAQTAAEQARTDAENAQAAAWETVNNSNTLRYKGMSTGPILAVMTDQKVGDVYLADPEYAFYMWDGAAWKSLATGTNGQDGVGIRDIALSENLYDDAQLLKSIYEITLTDGSTYEFEVSHGLNGANGNGIQHIAPVKDGETDQVLGMIIIMEDGTQHAFNIPSGAAGKSAYEIAVAAGFEGDVTEWLESLKPNTDAFEAEVTRLRESLSGVLTVTHLALSESAVFKSAVSGTDIDLLPDGEAVKITDGVSYTDWTRRTYNGGTHHYIHVAVSAQSPFNICFMDGTTVRGTTHYINLCEDYYTALGLTANDLVNGYIPAGTYTAVIDITGYYTYHGIYPSDGALALDGIAYNPTSVVGINGKDGYTPQKGVDYFTDADKAELVAAVISALPDGDEVSY